MRDRGSILDRRSDFTLHQNVQKALKLFSFAVVSRYFNFPTFSNNLLGMVVAAFC